MRAIIAAYISFSHAGRPGVVAGASGEEKYRYMRQL